MKYSTIIVKLSKVINILLLPLLFVVISSNSLKAQLDYIHYVPPFYAGAVGNDPIEGFGTAYTYPDGEVVYRGSWIGDQLAVLTTPNKSDNPVTVIIKNGQGQEIGRVTNLHTDNPQMYHLGDVYNPNTGQRELPKGIVLANKLNKVLRTEGLVFESLPNSNGKKQPFYVNIRHKTRIHGFSLTSKGQAALGTNFYSGHLRGKKNVQGNYGNLVSVSENQSHFISVMATEDNTSVTFANNKLHKLTSSSSPDYLVTRVVKKSIDFNGSVTVNLSKGQSYVFAVNHRYLNSDKEISDFNGTHITSTNPIVVNTGSWCSSLSNRSQDIGADQIVPTGSLGREYVVLKGDGGFLSHLLERPLVVATADNTEIYLNKENINLSAPDFVLAKAGDYKFIEADRYIGNVMYIKATKDIYVYQPTASKSSAANVGLNFIPPLTALGLRQVNIPFINLVGVGKILITAMNGEDVRLNGRLLTNPIPALGRLADSRWVCYIESNVPDKVIISSRKTIAVALTVKDQAVGAAGYFSGFTKFVSPRDPKVHVGPDKNLDLYCRTTGDKVKLAPDAGSDFVDVYKWYEGDKTNFISSDPYIIKSIGVDQTYYLESFYADPYLDIYNYGDFDNDLAFWSTDYNDEVGSFEGKDNVVRIVKNPKLASSKFISISDYSTATYPSVTKNMLLVSCGRETKNIWKSDGIPVDANEDYIFKAHAISVEPGLDKGQVLQLYVNNTPVGNPIILDKADINNDGKFTVDDWRSFAGVWNSGSETSVSLSVKNIKTGISSALAIDRISFSRAIKKEDSIEVAVSPPVVDPGLALHHSFCEGFDVQLDASSPDSKWFTYKWSRLGGTPILETNVSGIDSPILKFTSANAANEGDYQVHVVGSAACGKDNGDKKTFYTNVTMTSPIVFNVPELNTELCEGKDISLDLSSTTGGINNIEWFKNGVAIPGSNGVGPGSKALVYTYTANIADENPDKVSLMCRITGTCPAVEWNATVDVLETPIITKGLYLDKYEYCEDEEIILKVDVAGSANFEYTWFRSGVLIGTTSVGEFSFMAKRGLEGSDYSVLISTTNNCDPAKSYLVNDIKINDKVKIINTYETGDDCEGTSHSFNVEMFDASGTNVFVKYSYQWYYNNIAITGQTQSKLQLRDLRTNQSGIYKIIVSNSCNTEERSFTLHVKPNPQLLSEISASPSGEYCQTDKVELTVTANAFAVSYEWILPDGTKKVTNTPNLVLDPIGNMPGKYSVKALNACSESPSKIIDLTLKQDLDIWTNDIEVCDNDDAELVIYGNGTSFQWYKGEGAARVKINGASSKSYLILNPKAGVDDGIYTCDVTGNVCGSTTEKINLTINTIVSYDIDQVACDGVATVNMKVETIGNYKYQWFRILNSESAYTEIVGANASECIITLPTVAEAGLYKCVITHDACNTREVVGKLSMLKKTSVKSFPVAAINLCSNSELVISPIIDGEIKNIKWYKNDVLLNSFTDKKILKILNTSSADSGKYKIIVEGECGSITKVVDVEVFDDISIADQNTNISLCENEDLTITTAVLGSSITYAWYKDGVLLPTETSNVLSVKSVSVTDTGYYRMQVSSPTCGSKYKEFYVLVYKSLSVNGFALNSPTLCRGESLVLLADVLGEGLRYSWTLNGKVISTSKSININNFDASNLGEYKVNISSAFSCGNDVDLFSKPVLAKDLLITDNPSDKSVCLGDDATFSVKTSGSGTILYQWKKDGKIITGANSADYTVTATDMSFDNTLYSVDILDDCSNGSPISSKQAKLTVFEKTVFVSEPISKNVLVNSDVELSVSTKGNTKVTYQWQKENAAGAYEDLNLETNAKLVLSNLQLSDNGNKYRVLVSSTNVCDNMLTSKTALISVIEKTKITSNLTDIKICENTDAVFSVDSNIATATYKWYENTGSGFIAISNSAVYQNADSKSLTIKNVDSKFSAYSYKCLISGGLLSGNIYSEQAKIIVEKTAILNNVTDKEICFNDGLIIDLVASGTNISSYNWEFPDGTKKSSTISNLVIAQQKVQEGEYTVDLTAACGNPKVKFSVKHFAKLNLTDFDDSDLCSTDADRLLSVVVSGKGEFNYSWTKDSKELISGKANNSDKIEFLLTDLKESKSGEYSIAVTDGCDITKVISKNINIKDPAVILNPGNENYTICSNSSRLLTVETSGTDVNIQWSKDGVLLGKTTKSILVSEVGVYTVKLTTDVVCSESPEKKFIIQHNILPTVANIADVYVCENDNVKFSVKANTYAGGALDYQWYSNSGIIAGANKETYSFVANDAKALNSSYYYCIITDLCGLNVESNKAYLYVNTPAIVTVPSETIVADELLPLDLSFTHTGLGTYEYQWSLLGVNLSNNAEYSGVNTTTLHINSVLAKHNNAKYICTIRNIAQGACSNAATVDRIVKLRFANRIDIDAKNTTVCEDSPAKFTLALSAGFLTSKIQWQVNKTGDPKDWTVIKDNAIYTGSNATSLNVSSVSVSMKDYKYRANVDSGIEYSNEVYYIFKEKTVLSDITADPIVCANSELRLNAVASGFGALSYKWTLDSDASFTSDKNNLLLDADKHKEGTYTLSVTGDCGVITKTKKISHYQKLELDEFVDQTLCSTANNVVLDPNVRGAKTKSGDYVFTWKKAGLLLSDNTPTYTIVSDKSNSDLYTVSVEGMCGSLSTSASVVFEDPILANTVLESTVICDNSTVILTTDATGDNINYTWASELLPTTVLSTTNTLEVSDAGVYVLNLTSGVCASDISKKYEISHHPDLVINKQATDLVLCEGEEAVFEIAVSGANHKSGLKYQWFKNAGIDIIGATSAIYKIASVSAADNNNSYYCVISDDCNKEIKSIPASLEVNTKAVLAEVSKTISVNERSNVKLTVIASGLGIYTYQWKLNGVDISDIATANTINAYSGTNTNVLTISNVSAQIDMNKYICVITNTTVCGNKIEAERIVKVNIDKRIKTQAKDYLVCEDNTASFSIEIMSPYDIVDPIFGATKIQWQVNKTGLASDWTNIVESEGYKNSTSTSLEVDKVDLSKKDFVYRALVDNKAEVSTEVKYLFRERVKFNDITNSSLCQVNVLTKSALASGYGTLSYSWKNPANVEISTSPSLSYNNAEKGEYTISVSSDDATCPSVSKTFTLDHYQNLELDDIKDIDVCQGDNLDAIVNIKAGSNPAKADVYSWTRGTTSIINNTNTLSITNAQANVNDGLYTVNVDAICGSQSKSFSVTVKAPLVFAGNNTSETIIKCSDDSKLLKVDPLGDDLSFVWTKDATIIADVNNNSISVTDQAVYKVVITSKLSCGKSPSSKTFIVNNKKDLKIDSQPVDISICENTLGDAFVYNVSSVGVDDSQIVSYKWFRKLSASTDYLEISGETTNTYTLQATDVNVANDGDMYYSEITDDCGKTYKSTPALLSVVANLQVNNPVNNVSGPESGQVVFTVNTNNENNITYQWYYKIISTSAEILLTDGADVSGVNTKQLVLDNLPISFDSRVYICKVSKILPCTENVEAVFNLKVEKYLRISKQPSDINVCVDVAIPTKGYFFEVESLDASTTYQWQLSRDNGFSFNDILASDASYSGSNTAKLSIVKSIRLSMLNYKYRLIADKATVNEMSNVVGFVENKAVEFTSALSSDMKLCVNEDLKLSVSANGHTSTSLSYQWTLPDASFINNNELALDALNVQEGKYAVKVIGGTCGDISHELNLSVYDELSISNLDDKSEFCMSATTSNVLNVTVDKSATSIVNYKWSGPNVAASATGNSLNLFPDNLSKEGLYTVTVSDKCASVSKSTYLKIIEPIVITTDLTAFAPLCKGVEAKFDVVAKGDARYPISYKWINVNTNSTVGGNDINYTINSVQESDVAKYKVVLSDANTACSDVTSSIVDLSLLPILEIGELTAINDCVGSKAEFSVNVLNSSGNVSYQWYKDNTIINITSNATAQSSSFVISNTILSDAAYYHCVVTDDCNNVESNKVSLNLLTKPVLTSSKTISVNEDSDAILTVNNTGLGKFTYQWQLNAKDITDGAKYSGSTSAILNITKVQLSDNNTYTCIVTGVCSTETISIDLQVTPLSRIDIDATDAEVCENTQAVFSVSSVKAVSFLWQESNDGVKWTDINTADVNTNVVDTPGAGSVLTITSVDITLRDQKYRLVADKALATETISSVVSYVFKENVRILPLGDLVLCNNEDLNITVLATGSGVLNYTWNYDSADHKSTSNLLNVSRPNLGIYKLSVEGDCTPANGQIEIKKNVDLTIDKHLLFDPICSDASASTILKVEINPLSTGKINSLGNKYFDYKWFKDGIEISTDETFDIASLDEKAKGTYVLEVSDNCTSVRSNVFVDIHTPIEILNKDIEKLDVCLNSNEILSVNAKGDKDFPISYTWTQVSTSKTVGSNSNSLSLLDIVSDDTYKLKAYVANADYKCKPVEVKGDIKVKEVFSIDNLTDKEVCEGSDLSLEVELSNTAGTITDFTDYKFQWLENGLEIAGANNSTYTKTSVSMKDNLSTYSCLVIDACGISKQPTISAVLNVLENPTIASQTSSVLVAENNAASMYVNVSGNGLYSYQWQVFAAGVYTDISDASKYSGFNTRELTILSAKVDMAGYTFKCVVTNTSGPCADIVESLDIELKIKLNKRIDVNAKDAEICENSLAEFTVVSNSGSTFQWQVNTTGVASNWSDITDDALYSGSHTKVLTIKSVDISMRSYMYRVLVDKDIAAVKDGISSPVSFIFKENAKVLSKLDDILLCPTEALSINVSASAYGNMKYTWAYPVSGAIVNMPANASSALNIANAEDGLYTLKVEGDDCASISKTFNLSHATNVSFADLVSTPICESPTSANKYELKVNVSGSTFENGKYKYIWKKGAIELTSGEIDNTKPIAYTIEGKSASEEGVYSVEVSGKCSSKESDVFVVIDQPLVITSSSIIDQEVCKGENKTLSVDLTGDTDYPIVYSWTNTKLDALGDTKSLILSDIQLSDTYSLNVVSAASACNDNIIEKAIITLRDDLEITKQAIKGDICEDESYTFSIEANGAVFKAASQLTYQWYKDGIALTTNANDADYVVNNAKANADAGFYHCIVKDDCTQQVQSDIVELVINTKPVFTLEAKDKTVAENSSVIFTSQAKAIGGVVYQWYESRDNGLSFTALSDGGDYSGTTSTSLQIDNLQVSYSAYKYKLLATSSQGCSFENSTEVLLTVLAKTTIDIISKEQIICDGSSAVLEVSSNIPVTYQWQVNSGTAFVNIADDATDNYEGPTSNKLKILLVDDSNKSFLYRCIADGGLISGTANSTDIAITFKENVSITSISKDLTICPSEAVVLNATAKGSDIGEYKWTLASSSVLTSTVSSLALDSGDALNGTYNLQVTGYCNSVDSKVEISHYQVPVILDSFDSDVMCLNTGTRELSITMQGESPFTYSWSKDGVELATTDTYTIANTDITDAGLYELSVTAAHCGTVNASKHIEISKPVVINKKWNAIENICIGSDFSFVADVSGDNLTYKWFYNNKAIVGAKSSVLDIKNSDFTKAGIYRCEVSNDKCGSETLETELIIDTLTKITSPLEAIKTICEQTENETLSVLANGANLKYQWSFNNGNGDIAIGTDANTYVIPKFELANQGQYKVVVTGSCGSDQNISDYSMIEFVKTMEELKDELACEGSALNLKVFYTGDIDSYQWKVDGKLIAGANTPAYTVDPVVFGADVVYTCDVIPTCGKILSSSSTVRATQSTKLLQGLADAKACENEDVLISAKAQGEALTYSWQLNGKDIAGTENFIDIKSIDPAKAGLYTLSIKGHCGSRFTSSYVDLTKKTSIVKDLPITIEKCENEIVFADFLIDGDNLTYKWTKNGYDYSKADSDILQLDNLLLSDAGTYNVKVQGLCGDVDLSTELIVTTKTVISKFLFNQSVCENDNVIMHVLARGDNLKYQWFKGNKDLNTTSNTYTIAAASMSDIGNYKCIVTGSCGSQETIAELNVMKRPVVTTQPIGEQVVCENTKIVNITANVEGDDLTLQWRKNGVDIVGAKHSTYTITGVELSDDAEYSLYITSHCGDEVLSNISRLQVNPVLKITDVSNGKSLCVNEALDLFVIAEGENLTYQWRKDGLDIAGQTQSTLSISAVSDTDGGIYNCIVNGDCSDNTSSVAIPVIVNKLPDASIFGRIDVCAGEQRVVFQTGKVNGYSYNWSIEKGDFYDSKNPAKVSTNWNNAGGDILELGKLSINLIIERTGCSARIDSIINIHPLPVVSVSDMTTVGSCFDPVELKSGLVSGVPAQGGIYWINNKSEKFFDPRVYGSGSFPIAYSFTDDWGCSNKSESKLITVAKKPKIELVEDLILASCKTTQLDTVSTSGTLLASTVKWGNSKSLSNLSVYNPIFTPGVSGIYTIEVKDKYDCIAKDFVEILVAPLPDVTTINDTIVGQCKALMLTAFTDSDKFTSINWSNPDHLDNPQSLTPRLNLDVPLGTHNYKVDIVDAYGCNSSADVNVQVMENPDLGVDVITGCEGEEFTVDLTSQPLAKWVNIETNEEDTNVTDYPVRLLKEVGEYKIIAKNKYDCKDQQSIIIRPKPNLYFALDIDPSPEKWELFQKEIHSQGDTIFTIFTGETLNMNLERLEEKYSPYTFQWKDITDPNAKDSKYDSSMPYYDINRDAKLSLFVTDSPINDKVCTSFKTFRVEVKPDEIITPNAFTPESEDGVNDRFYQKDVYFVKDYELQIFNRWGELLFSTKEIGYAGGWNGRFKGKLCPLGGYNWISYSDGKVINSGSFLLVR